MIYNHDVGKISHFIGAMIFLGQRIIDGFQVTIRHIG